MLYLKLLLQVCLQLVEVVAQGGIDAWNPLFINGDPGQRRRDVLGNGTNVAQRVRSGAVKIAFDDQLSVTDDEQGAEASLLSCRSHSCFQPAAVKAEIVG